MSISPTLSGTQARIRAAPLFNGNERHAVEHEHGRHNRRGVQVRIHPVIQGNAHHGAGQNRDHDLEPQADRVHFEKALDPLALFRHPERPELAKVEHHHRQDGPQLDDHRKHGLKCIAHLKLHELVEQDHVSRGTDRQPLRDAFHNTKEQRLERFDPKNHRHSPSFIPI